MRKDGKTSEGRQRWKCTFCGLRTTVRRRDALERSRLRLFLSWLLEEGRQGVSPARARAFRRHAKGCWALQPFITPDGGRHPVVMADGTYVGGHGLLIVCDGVSGSVLAWRWCVKENSKDYEELFRRVTKLYGKPLLLVSDGMRGIVKAAHTAWPTCRLQR